MNLQEHLLTCLGEEAVEVALSLAQHVSKTTRFGINEVQPGQPLTNRERIAQEFNDLIAVRELLEDHGVTLPINREAIDAKKAKVLKFAQYAREQGALT